MASWIYFQFTLGQLTILFEIINDLLRFEFQKFRILEIFNFHLCEYTDAYCYISLGLHCCKDKKNRQGQNYIKFRKI